MSCDKHVFVTRKGAKEYKRNINTWAEKKMTNIYWCDKCSGYHLTTMDKKQSRNITFKNK